SARRGRAAGEAAGGPAGGGAVSRRGVVRRAAGELGLLLAGAAAGAGLVWFAFRAAGFRAGATLCVAAGLAAAACWRLAAAVAPPPVAPPERFDRPAPDDGLVELTALEHRLSWGSVDADRFRERVRPLLVDLAVARLRVGHGLDPAAQPEESRRILGESLWQMVTGPSPSRSPSRPELARLVEALERI
ncbi:MAG TPA: hypothetical protein VE547_22180, partial [Mycobacteriales bacterium]|nr:hypothetical protein [Mycobacteriales bacterium]